MTTVSAEEVRSSPQFGRFTRGEDDSDEDDCLDVPEISPNVVAEIAACPTLLKQTILLDVRTPCEFTCERILGAVLIPLNDLALRACELDARLPVVCLCAKGVRSETAARLLMRHGFAQVASMRGGMVRYPGPVVRGYCPDAPL